MTFEYKPLSDTIHACETDLRLASQKAAAVDAVIAERRTRAVVLQNNISQAQYRLDLQPSVESYMLVLQQRVHQRSVGIYEQLLTALVQDVLPENPYPITLELDTEKGLPALSIQLGSDSTAQDIYEDTGGSLTNVVSSGLRFVALARSPLRKFLVLDEPDCWIEPFRVPRFADILSEMSTDIGIQAILISHHNDSAFANIEDRMRLEKDAAGVIQVRRVKKAAWQDDTVPGIRWIRLQRFMSHFDTLIELGPGINVLSGPNHIGKSAIVNALRVFCYQQGADRNIMHGHNDFVISMGLENGQVLTCTRVRKGGRKTVYSYVNPTMDKPRVEPADKNKVPDFVLNALNIQKLNDLDIQLSHQKMPVFLLNEPRTKQASLLSAGMESDHVRQMLRQYKNWLDLDRATIRNEDKELAIVKTKLETWDKTFSGIALADEGLRLETTRSELHTQSERIVKMMSLVTVIEKAERLEAALPDAVTLDTPVLPFHQGMLQLCDVWAQAQRQSQIEVKMACPVTPELVNMTALTQFGQTWQGYAKRANALEAKAYDFPETPKLVNTDSQTLLDTWKTQETQSGSDSKQHASALDIFKTAETEYQEAVKALGGICPTCQQTWPHHHEDSHVTH